jgi:hypothetical protein
VIWALIAALAPAVRSGLCRLWVLDPKGGMELAMGAPMFTRFAYRSAEEIAAALDDPLMVLIVDELGALTKQIAEVELQKRIEAALGLLLSQGAGLGILVVGALQDPRKENLDLRDLFLSRILLGSVPDRFAQLRLAVGTADHDVHESDEPLRVEVSAYRLGRVVGHDRDRAPGFVRGDDDLAGVRAYDARSRGRWRGAAPGRGAVRRSWRREGRRRRCTPGPSKSSSSARASRRSTASPSAVTTRTRR